MPCRHHDSRGNRCHLGADHDGACEARRLTNPGADHERPQWATVRWVPSSQRRPATPSKGS